MKQRSNNKKEYQSTYWLFTKLNKMNKPQSKQMKKKNKAKKRSQIAGFKKEIFLQILQSMKIIRKQYNTYFI